MFSGKTTLLIQRVEALSGYEDTVVCLKPEIDDRYSRTDIVTHDGQRLEARTVRSAAEVRQIAEDTGATIVAVDEIHFFPPTIIDIFVALIDSGRRIICCGLDRDMWGDPFEHVFQLAALGRKTVMLGTCKACGAPADRTQRTQPLTDDNLVGGSEAFESRCAACFYPPSEAKPVSEQPGLA